MEEYLRTAPKHMMGAIIGDIVGSIYEFHNIHTTDFDLFSPGCDFTDDTVMTVAVAQALLNWEKHERRINLYDELIDCMRLFGRRYPGRGYGTRFNRWLAGENTDPGDSWGNGAPMRASAAGWLAISVSEAERLGNFTASTTHRGASYEASTAAMLIAMGREGKSIDDACKLVSKRGYDISAVPDIVDFDVSARGTMPVALKCFLEGSSFEDVLRRSIAIGGDSDTIAAIACSIAEAYYDIPDAIRDKAWEYLPRLMRRTLHDFNDAFLT